ncbi:MAG: cell division protein ZapB [bacterium]|nr:cell division protein ZapB [bacterium]
MMDLQFIDMLEEKVNRMVQQLGQLKTENRELRMRNQELQAILEDKERAVYTLRTELDQSRAVQGEIENYRKSQDRIRSKVETLLEKLKDFENIP